MLLLSLVFLLGCDTALLMMPPLADFNKTDECLAKGGQCVSSLTDCDMSEHLRTGPCDVDSLCCVSMESACETHHSGFCADNPSDCSTNRQGYVFNWLYCGENRVCCVPVFGSHMPPFGGHGHLMEWADLRNMAMKRMGMGGGMHQLGPMRAMVMGGGREGPFPHHMGGGGGHHMMGHHMMGGGRGNHPSGGHHVIHHDDDGDDDSMVRGGGRRRAGRKRGRP